MTLAVRIARGVALVLWSLWRRLWAAGERDHDRIGPIALVAFGGAALLYVLQRAPIAGAPLTLALLVAGYRAGRAPDPGQDETGEDDQEQPEEPAEPLGTAELAAALRELAAPHVHLSALAEHLQTTPARVRERLTAAGIPIAGGVRMTGRGVSTGVRADDIPPLSSPTETRAGPVVAAGQPSNNNSNNGTSVKAIGQGGYAVQPRT